VLVREKKLRSVNKIPLNNSSNDEIDRRHHTEKMLDKVFGPIKRQVSLLSQAYKWCGPCAHH